MAASGSADLQDCDGKNFQPGEGIAFPPFSGNLNVDEGLKFSCEHFTQSIGDFYKDKIITPLTQLTATPPFPTPYLLAQFASKAYTDYESKETDEKYEKRLALPEGWKLLTTASNITKTNGYFGAAYWHPEYQQVVIAHRGTKLTNLGALWTDLKGMLLNEYVGQMKSASTFAHKVVEVLREVTQTKRVSFQLFFTGHSLGGWLAQITTFTTEYLKREGKFFLRSMDDNDCYHPHTVVFDSPGCKDMLSEMRDTFDVRLDGRSIDIEHLDITSYQSAPNRINTCDSHLGTVGTVRTICQPAESMPELEVNLELFGLYGRFIERKYEIYQEEKLQLRASNVAAKGLREHILKTMREDHQLLALKVFFTEEIVALFQNNTECSFSNEDMTRIGIVQVSHDGQLQFIHRKFAEYFVADYFVNRLTDGRNISEQVLHLILEKIFVKEHYQVIRVFIDCFLLISNPSAEVLKECGNRINDFGDYAEIILQTAAREGNAEIMGFLLDSAQAAGHTEGLHEMLLGYDKKRKTPWELAAEMGNIEVIKKI